MFDETSIAQNEAQGALSETSSSLVAILKFGT